MTFIIFLAIYMGWIGYMPPIEQLQNPVNKFASQIISADGEVMGSYATMTTLVLISAVWVELL